MYRNIGHFFNAGEPFAHQNGGDLLIDADFPDEEVDEIVASVEDALYALGESDIPSKQVGDFVLDELAGRNEVAYVRFASVYFDFTSLDEFEEILAQRRKKKLEE